MVIWAVHPHVDQVRGGSQHARQARAAHHAVRDAVRGKQRKGFLAMPAGMPELHRDPYPARDEPEEVGQPGVIARVRRRELDQQYRALVAQLVPARRDALQPRLRRVSAGAHGSGPGVP